MKPKKLNKKLAFNKGTIANLSNSDQQEVQGGAVPTIISKIDTWCRTNCPSAEPTWPWLCASCSCQPPCYLP
jgi:hypothetical protein